MTLAALRDDALARLAAAVAARDHPCRTPVLATVGPDGAPGARTVVLRGVDAAARAVDLHTDARSAKVAALRREARAVLVFHDPGAAVQLRLSGRVALHAGDAVAAAAWARVPDASRTLYATAEAPGTPAPAPPPPAPDPAAGIKNFAVLRLVFDGMEVLHLDPPPHRRAVFAWDAAGREGATWVVP